MTLPRLSGVRNDFQFARRSEIALRCLKHLELMAPRPGLEPGTERTQYVSMCRRLFANN